MTIWYSGPFVERLTKSIVELCASRGIIKDRLFDVEDLEERWKKSAPQYMADSVPEIARYPMVAIAWAAYYGIGAAVLWDAAWEKVKDIDDLYVYIRDVRGYDCMDEYVMDSLLDVKAGQKRRALIDGTLQECAQLALSLIRKEGIEPASVEAFQMYAKTTEIFFRLGATIALTTLGYKLEKVNLNLN